MMSTAPFLILEQPYERALAWVIKQLSDLGLRVLVTFDLQAARHIHTDCTCPHHGTEACDCRLNVVLIYGKSPGPVSLLAHGYEGKTWFSLVDTPEQPIDPRLGAMIRKTLIPNMITEIRVPDHIP